MFLCVYVFTKYACVKPFTGQKAKTVLNGFTKIVDILNVNQINDGLIKEENLTISVCIIVRKAWFFNIFNRQWTHVSNGWKVFKNIKHKQI